ncbi:MAG TPA: HAMP domain-containing sensor histidine kinase [Thermomicrobiaceae bacterium]|nr:HAMP domain-containing sensor histidine kinase [Thermomicrobiaceae bacterium]
MKNLRGRLLLSHLVVLALAVLLTFIVALIPVRRSERQLEVNRLQEIAAPVVVQTAYVYQHPALGPGVIDELLQVQSRQLDARLLLFDSNGELAYDTAADQPLPADTVNRIHQSVARLPSPGGQGGPLARALVAGRVGYAGSSHGQEIVVARIPQTGNRSIALLAPARRLPLLRQLFVPLLLAAAVGVLGAVIATVFLSRSIARPISRLTAAADAVAAGDWARQVPGEGEDEVGRLVHSFNTMVNQLRSTYESQRRLLANIAHELRTPLTSVQGYAQALSDDVFTAPEAREEALRAIREESERVNELVLQVLQLARLESGQAEPRPRPVDLDELIARVLRRERVAAGEAGVALTGPAWARLSIVADEALLDQAIDNLVRNAIRHTPAGGSVDISVSTAALSGKRERRLKIRVSDSGSGIPPGELAHIFDRFYRGSDEAPPDGFGLGLAIVREIAFSHGGDVSAESEPGRGATFVIDLPLRLAAEGDTTATGIIEQPARG